MPIATRCHLRKPLLTASFIRVIFTMQRDGLVRAKPRAYRQAGGSYPAFHANDKNIWLKPLRRDVFRLMRSSKLPRYFEANPVDRTTKMSLKDVNSLLDGFRQVPDYS